MTSDWDFLLPSLSAIGIALITNALLPKNRTWGRSVMVALMGYFLLRYSFWRFTETVWPTSPLTLDGAWVWLLFLAECAGLIEVAVFLTILARTKDRSREADILERNLITRDPAQVPSVDVFIPTYNEGPEVLERTLAGCLALQYPKFTVWVLDDGDRDWLRDICAERGVKYLRRDGSLHAKAGNLNNALQYATGDLIAIFDADFVPTRNFLLRTVGFFDDPKIGIVQAPQHFFNPDPIQNSLSLHKNWPNEQRLFFDVMAPGRDAWDVSFCCGSCSVTRRSALDAIGGFPTGSITEDLLTTLALLRKGFVTRYLNEKLAFGLAPEDLQGYFIQRQRWCKGALQTLFLKDGPLGPGLSLFQRFMFIPWGWIIQFPVRLLLLLVPVVFLWTGLSPLPGVPSEEILRYLAPTIILGFAGLRFLAPGAYLPVMSTACGVFTSFRILPTVIDGFISPLRGAFRVTPKGKQSHPGGTDKRTLLPILAIGTLTALGIAINLFPDWQTVGNDQFIPFGFGWAFLNLVILGLAARLCFESPRAREEERFVLRAESLLQSNDARFACHIEDLSLTGAFVRFDAGHTIDERGKLFVFEVGWISYVRVRAGKDFAALRFDTLSSELRSTLTEHLFSEVAPRNGVKLNVKAVLSTGLRKSLWD